MTTDSHYFLAISIPSQLKSWVKEQQQEFLQLSKLSYKRYVDLDDFHITLKFLGPVSLKKKELLINQLQQLEKMKPFHLSIGSVGFFGSPIQPRVCWLGVDHNNDLFNLFDEIESIADKNGFQKEKRPFQPHITLAKKWASGHLEKQDWNQINTQINEKRLITVDTFKLYRVVPNEKPMYQVVQAFKFR